MLSEKIEIFIDAANSLRFSAVAKKRYTTQPTISRQISALEEEWGVELFVRSNKGLRLTPEGAIMLNCCKKMQASCEQSLALAREIRIGKQDKLRLGFLYTLDVERLFMPFMESFSQIYRELDISLTHASFGDLRRGLEKNEFDIIYTLDFEKKNFRSEIVSEQLKTLKPCIVLSKQHPLYEKENLKIEDLVNEYFYLPENNDSPGREDDLRMILKSNGIGNGKIRFVANLESVLFQVKMGKGAALLDDITKEVANDCYRSVELKTHEGALELVSIWKKDNLNPFLTLFINKMLEHRIKNFSE